MPDAMSRNGIVYYHQLLVFVASHISDTDSFRVNLELDRYQENEVGPYDYTKAKTEHVDAVLKLSKDIADACVESGDNQDTEKKMEAKT